jgi:hypothetical protein
VTDASQPIRADPSTYYLRFKHGRSTTLIFADPTTPIREALLELLSALQEIHPDGLPITNSTLTLPIPDKADDVRIALPNDEYDPAQGYTEVEWQGSEQDEKGKGKVLASSWTGMDIPDNAMLAYVFRGTSEDGESPSWNIEVPSYDDEEEMEGIE